MLNLFERSICLLKGHEKAIHYAPAFSSFRSFFISRIHKFNLTSEQNYRNANSMETAPSLLLYFEKQ